MNLKWLAIMLQPNWLVLLFGVVVLSGTVVGIALGIPAIAVNDQGQNGNGQVQIAPEIDPGALSGAVTLLVSGTLILNDRFRRK